MNEKVRHAIFDAVVNLASALILRDPPDGDRFYTMQNMLDHGDERLSRLYGQVIAEAKEALGEHAPNADSWLAVLHAIHSVTGTPLPDAVEDDR